MYVIYRMYVLGYLFYIYALIINPLNILLGNIHDSRDALKYQTPK